MSILIIQTGGTIDKIYPKSINGWGFEIGNAAVHRILSKKELSVDYRIISACKKDSTQINENDRKNILNICQKSSEEQIIITHGTDTILDTAKFLSIIENKTIVLTGSFLPPTALKMLRTSIPKNKSKKLFLKSVASGGEPLGAELLDWGKKVLGVNINEIYGQTECNLVLSSCSKIMKPRPGIAGPPVPGSIVSVIDQNGRKCKKTA